VAAFLEPEILIIDEVLAVGDAEFQKKCLGRMKDVSVNDGRTVLFVSHNMAAVSTLCNKSLLMYRGGIRDFGATKQIIDEYISIGRSSNGELLEDEINLTTQHPNLKLKRVATVGKNGPSNSFGLNEEIVCEIDYEVCDDNLKVYPSIHLLNKYGDCIFASINSDSANLVKDDFFDKAQPNGVYRVKCIIPKFFLNDTRYSINVFLSPDKNFNNMTAAEEVISFDVHETGEMRQEHSGSWIGQIRPKLAWSTKKIN
jgi:lipopolysaccharide transport system ATP-binding protein